MKDAFKTEKEIDEDYEEAAWQYFGNGHDDGRPHENIYLMKFSKRTLRQVFNMLRSKLVYESRLQKTDGKVTSWHAKVRSFHDGTVDVEALLEFARVHTDLLLGDEGVARKDQYPNELLPTHKGMTKLDWCHRVWMDIRKMKFDEKGRLNGKRVARKRGKRVTIVVKPTRTNESGDESSGSMDLHVSDAEGVSGDSDGDARMKSNPYELLRTKRGKKVAGAKKGATSTPGDYDEAVATEREKELMARVRMAEEKLEESKTRVQMAEDETQKADGKVDAMEQKLQATDRQKLPTLVADRLLAYDSAEKFRTVTKGNFYRDMQVITHIQAQALDKKPHVVEGGKEETTQVPWSYRRPAQMLKLVSTFLNEDERAKKTDGRAHMKVNGAEWARAVLLRFWAKWDEDFPDVLQESRKTALVEAWHADWLSLRFWYYHEGITSRLSRCWHCWRITSAVQWRLELPARMRWSRSDSVNWFSLRLMALVLAGQTGCRRCF
jgi:hypothetical protein